MGPQDEQYTSNQPVTEINKHSHSLSGMTVNTTAVNNLNEPSVEPLHQVEELAPPKALLEPEFAINGDTGIPHQQQQPTHQQPQMMQKPIFDMSEQQNMPQFQQLFPADFNLPGLSAGLNNAPTIGGQPPYWSNSAPQHSAPTEDFFGYGPPSVNGNFSFPPNIAPPAQALNTVLNQNFMNFPHLALNAHNRRSPVYNPTFPGPRHTPNLYPLKNFGQPNGWTNNSQTPWNAITSSPWNQLPKRDARNAPFDSMRFPQLESSLLDIMRSELPDQMRQRRNPFFAQVEDFDDHAQGTGGGHFNPNDPMMATNLSNLNAVARANQYPERFSRKVFVGGLPPDIDEEEITQTFRRFGPLVVDWPHKAESKSYFPPKGYAFLLFQEEASVQALIDQSMKDDGKLYICVSSPTIKDKAVQIRPWNLADSDYVMDGGQPLDPRKTIFVGGVPRPLKAQELARIMDRLYGGVCYAGIDTDPELKYPKGAGRVAFSNQQSYIAAISARFVQLQHGDIDKRVEVKPYVLDDQMCDECHGNRCNGKYAPYFCANVMCLQYYCDQCWNLIHSRQGREYHKPLVKEGGDRNRGYPSNTQPPTRWG